MQGVEGVEELLLETLLVLHELHVVDEQDIAVAVSPLEDRHRVGADGVDELVHERLRRHVPHAHAGVVLSDVVGDGVQEVGLAQPGCAVDEQRVVGLGRRLGDRQGGGVGEAVGRADHEGLKGVAGVDRQVVGPAFGCVLWFRCGHGWHELVLQVVDVVILVILGACLWVHLEANVVGSPAYLFQGGPQDVEVAALDALASEDARDAQHQAAALEGNGAGHPEAALPRRFRHAGAEDTHTGVPQPFFRHHQGERLPRRFSRPQHRPQMWKSGDGGPPSRFCGCETFVVRGSSKTRPPKAALRRAGAP